MKLLAIFILCKDNGDEVKILQNEFNLDHLYFFQRQHVRSFLIFTARTAVQHTDRGIKQSITPGKDLEGIVHVYVRSDGLAAVTISDDEYPKRVAHTLLNKVMDDFTSVHPATSWTSIVEGSGKMTSLNEILMKYQSPQKADPLMSLQKDLDETKEILCVTLENVLKRGESIDTLMARSQDLTADSKILFERTKKLNRRCCGLF